MTKVSEYDGYKLTPKRSGEFRQVGRKEMGKKIEFHSCRVDFD